MWRGAKDLDERGRRTSALDDTDADALAGNGKRNVEPLPAGVSDAVTVWRERLDVDDMLAGLQNAAAGLPAAARSAKAGQLTFRSSTSKTSVAFGGMTPPAPCAP